MRLVPPPVMATAMLSDGKIHVTSFWRAGSATGLHNTQFSNRGVAITKDDYIFSPDPSRDSICMSARPCQVAKLARGGFDSLNYRSSGPGLGGTASAFDFVHDNAGMTCRLRLVDDHTNSPNHHNDIW